MAEPNAVRIAMLYALGAATAICANILTQDLALRVLPPDTWTLFPSVLCGTAVGLVFKYTWDKALIFEYRPPSAVRDLKTFVSYAFTGVFTTCVFWGFEFGFHFLFGTKTMRYAGAAIGLVIGYWLKYRLDKRFVFRQGRDASA